MNDSVLQKLSWEAAVETLRRDPCATGLVLGCYYDDPLVAAAERFVASEEWNHVRQMLSARAGRVLDVGAGRGISSYAFAKQGWEVTALEPDPSDIVGAGAIRRLAAESGLKIDVVQEWGESLPFDVSQFDLVYGRAVFHHANDLKQFCNEVFRVLRSGGQFLITREHVISKNEDLQTFLASHPLHKFYGGEAAYLLKDYLGAMEQAGLTLQSTLGPHSSPINYYPMKSQDHLEKLAWRLGGSYTRLGRMLAKLLVTLPFIRRQVELRLNAEDSYPGRLYSFLAVKP